MAIKDVIDNIGLSFDELCDASEIPSSTLSDILSRKGGPESLSGSYDSETVQGP
jgi:hypothetical protein